MKHKPLFGRLLILALFITFVPAALASSTWYVNGVNGNDDNNCQTPQNACKTIDHAISLASSGDSIMVAPAIYRETLTINFSLKIVGSNAKTTIIDGGGIDTVIHVPRRSASVVLSALTIRDGSTGIVSYGALAADDITISGNSPRGGIENDGTMMLDHSTISGNTANGGSFSAGGGVNNGGMLTINNSTISENIAKGTYVCGGGVFNDGTTLTITNSTLDGNQASGDINSAGGGINSVDGALVLNNSTLSGNVATATGSGYGSGIANGRCFVDGSASFSVTLQNSIIANSKGGNCYGPMTSNGYNLSSDDTCHFKSAGDLNNTHPELGPLKNNGGPTKTKAELLGSPTIDAGNPSGCTDSRGHLLKTDQRGEPRPGKYKHDKRCDMGAFERQSD
jgi:hypothetical protein